MKEFGQKVVSVAMLAGGITLTIIGAAGLFLPVIPGFVLILAGLWMINKVYKHPWLDKIVEFVRQKMAVRRKNTHKGE